MDRLTALEVFRCVAELNSFAAAARRLGFSPASVSKHIAELESSVGHRLINRTTRSMALTVEGQAYLDHVAPALEALADAEQLLSQRSDAPTGLLRVSAPMTLSLTRLSRAIPLFLNSHPALRLDLNLEDRRVDIIREGFDLAIRGSDRLEDTSLIARKLGVMTHVLVAAPDYWDRTGRPSSPAEVSSNDCVRFSLSGHPDMWEFHQGGV